MKIINVVGARPNFMKIAPIHNRMLKSAVIKPYLVHTGQHYDEKMSKVFFDDLGMPEPDRYLYVGSGSHAVQTAKIMVEFEKVCEKLNPDLVLVAGDVNSTVACAMVAKKMNIKVAHVEAGLRSFDKTMPEEINRLLTDVISDYLFVSEESGIINLRNEGVSENRIIYTGNVMIDSLVNNFVKAECSDVLTKLGLVKGQYVLTTLHRPSNVDDETNTRIICEIFHDISKEVKIVFPIHPRSLKNIEKFGLLDNLTSNRNILIIEPASYLDFMKLMKDSLLVLTDSGGIQEETTYLKKPCLTLRSNTERPSTIDMGTNILIQELSKNAVLGYFENIKSGNFKKGQIPHLWDGKASERIVNFLINKHL
ncbi:MAG: UDP-N-acetylglucosamine 2-epimerase (non-hydrolyzing) [Candidatus Delongbacteria bacterium]|nr:UDP-N-acetylglucosamine 2-epimerase (non-hydrolyzing) [Candidatus Delongbacteria bacterium]MBN2834439.1 UDP-N-acetylglucosamine 2-epimerase (non-hydrolyzing) [Candidatus Delongbacteria bacterium]